MNASSEKASRRERELVNWFRANGWGAIRIPTSGSATGAPLPDVLAGSGSMDLAIEAKTGAQNVLYVGQGELTKLRAFGNAFGAIPCVGCRWDQDRVWYLWVVPDMAVKGASGYRRTDSGQYAFDHPDPDEWDGWCVTPDAYETGRPDIDRETADAIIDDLGGDRN